MSSPAFNALFSALVALKAPVAPPPAGTPTAPNIVSGSMVQNFNNGTSSPLTVTIPTVLAGQTVVVAATAYEGGVISPDPAISASGYTWTARTTNIPIGNPGPPSAQDLALKVFTAAAPSNASNVVVTLPTGDYKSMIAFVLNNNDAAVLDVAVQVVPSNYIGSGVVVSGSVTTSYSHTLVVGIAAWYTSEAVFAVDTPNWPALSANGTGGWNAGSNDRNQMLVIGKQVTAAGTYSPSLTGGATASEIVMVVIAFKGKAV